MGIQIFRISVHIDCVQYSNSVVVFFRAGKG
jgi:hypothetical protein